MKLILRVSALTLLLSLPATAAAWQPGGSRVKIDAGINCRFNVYIDDQQSNPLAPWYLYWPSEAANLPPGPVGMNFPTWPATWPPTGDKQAPAGPKMPEVPPAKVPMPGPNPPALPLFQPPTATPGAVQTHSSYPFQPVGYYSPAPSYWYGP
jgi:hypothetical protein